MSINTPQQTTTEQIITPDLQQHIQDSRLCWVYRHGAAVKLAWNELTATEKSKIISADRRAAYRALYLD